MTRKIQHAFRLVIFTPLFFMAFLAHAQDWRTEKRVNLVFGMTQPLVVSGFNIEGNYIHNRWILGYSHGMSLDFSGTTLTGDLRRQGLVVHMPWTTGFGIGYRLKEWVNLRIEPKWHRFELYEEGMAQTAANEVAAYNTMSLGIGVYGHFQPFKTQTSFLRGIMIAPSIRFWPTIASTLPNNSYDYFNTSTLQSEEITVLEPGMGFKPIIFNVSIGYSFDLGRKR